jgi:alanine racemase
LPERSTCTKSQTLPAPETGEHACEFALTSTGRLLIDTGAERFGLSKDQAEQLMAYLGKQRGIEWEAA